MATDQAYLQHTSPLAELGSRLSKWNSSANEECVSALSSVREMGRTCGDVHQQLATKSPSTGTCGETLLFGSAVSARVTVGEYIECKFVPEYISLKTSTGQMHFRSILKFVLSPEAMQRAFITNSRTAKQPLRPIPGSPYMDSVPLSEVTRSCVQGVVSGALDRGYSVQTATHIRNVIRMIFAHAAQNRFFSGENPAASVILPALVRKTAPVLTLDQLKRFLRSADYPERELALVATLTTMSMAEICGLQWKYVNSSEFRRRIDGDWLDAKTIAVRMKSYRGKLGPVVSSRKRAVGLPDLLNSALSRLKGRTKFGGQDDYVFVSRSGSPVSQDNLARRKLKAIGEALGMSGLSWHVFRRSRGPLHREIGRQLQNELKAAMSLTTTPEAS